jgi:putative exosortase-associated protein (TIGR04073 family)
MRNTFPFLAALVIAGALASGCANVEKKFGRGLSNSFDIVRGGEFRRTVEQTALFDSPDIAYTTGVIRGINRTLARTGLGVYEIVTAPLPPYDPIFTNYLAPYPVYPENFTPGLVADSMFATDTDVGFAGGDILPFVPGSRFAVFVNH